MSVLTGCQSRLCDKRTPKGVEGLDWREVPRRSESRKVHAGRAGRHTTPRSRTVAARPRSRSSVDRRRTPSRDAPAPRSAHSAALPAQRLTGPSERRNLFFRSVMSAASSMTATAAVVPAAARLPRAGKRAAAAGRKAVRVNASVAAPPAGKVRALSTSAPRAPSYPHSSRPRNLR